MSSDFNAEQSQEGSVEISMQPFRKMTIKSGFAVASLQLIPLQDLPGFLSIKKNISINFSKNPHRHIAFGYMLSRYLHKNGTEGLISAKLFLGAIPRTQYRYGKMKHISSTYPDVLGKYHTDLGRFMYHYFPFDRPEDIIKLTEKYQLTDNIWIRDIMFNSGPGIIQDFFDEQTGSLSFTPCVFKFEDFRFKLTVDSSRQAKLDEAISKFKEAKKKGWSALRLLNQ